MKSAIRVPSAEAYFRPKWVERFITFACVPSVKRLTSDLRKNLN